MEIGARIRERLAGVHDHGLSLVVSRAMPSGVPDPQGPPPGTPTPGLRPRIGHIQAGCSYHLVPLTRKHVTAPAYTPLHGTRTRHGLTVRPRRPHHPVLPRRPFPPTRPSAPACRRTLKSVTSLPVALSSLTPTTSPKGTTTSLSGVSFQPRSSLYTVMRSVSFSNESTCKRERATVHGLKTTRRPGCTTKRAVLAVGRGAFRCVLQGLGWWAGLVGWAGTFGIRTKTTTSIATLACSCAGMHPESRCSTPPLSHVLGQYNTVAGDKPETRLSVGLPYPRPPQPTTAPPAAASPTPRDPDGREGPRILARLRRPKRPTAKSWGSTFPAKAPPHRCVQPVPSPPRPLPPRRPLLLPHHERELLVEVRVAVVVDCLGLLVAPAPHLAAHVQVVAAADALQAQDLQLRCAVSRRETSSAVGDGPYSMSVRDVVSQCPPGSESPAAQGRRSANKAEWQLRVADGTKCIFR